MKWKDKLINDLFFVLNNDAEWTLILEKVIHQNQASVHLAIFNEPFLSMVFNGEKKIESRFSINNVAPFGRVKKGDIVVIKKSGGNIQGVFQAGETLYFTNLTEDRLSVIEQKYGKDIGWYVDPGFFSSKSGSSYMSLIYIERVRRFEYITNKADRTAWSVLITGLNNTLFDFVTNENV